MDQIGGSNIVLINDTREDEGASKEAALQDRDSHDLVRGDLVEQACAHARALLEAEVALGRVVVQVGLCRVGTLAKALGVRRNMLVDAAARAQGLIRSHGKLEREVLLGGRETRRETRRGAQQEDSRQKEQAGAAR